METQLLPGVNQKLFTDSEWNWTCGAGLLVWRSGWFLIVTTEDWSWESLLSDLCPFRNGAQNVQKLSLLIKGMGIMMLALQWGAKEMVSVNGFCTAWSFHRSQRLIPLDWTLRWPLWLACSRMLCHRDRRRPSWSLRLGECSKSFLTSLNHYPLKQVGREYWSYRLDIYR